METIRFEDLELDAKIMRAITDMGFEAASPIQGQAIPLELQGLDIIGQAQTGTGKTAAFGIPLLQKIDPKNKKPQAIILCPTRELAIQVSEEIRRLAKYMHGVKVLPIYGGQEIGKQIRSLKGGVQVVSCPTCGRTKIDQISLANQVEALAAQFPNLDIKVAVMGCVVNGPGEAKEADLGIAGGIGEGLLIKKGQIIRKIPEAEFIPTLRYELEHWNEQ